MPFFQLVRREMQGSLRRLAIMSGLGGASNAAILAAINSGAQAAGNGEVSIGAAAIFIIALLLFIKTQHYILIAATVEIEAIIHKLRMRLMDQVRHSELLPLDEIGRAEIVAAITKETQTLTQATNMLAFAGQGVVLVFFVAIYIAYLSLLAFAVRVGILVVAGMVFHAKSQRLAAENRQAAEWDNRLFDRLMDLLDGFKEVRLNRSRSDHLFDDVVEVSRTAANIKIRTQSESYKQLVFSQSSMYLLLASIVFAVPTFSATKGGSITQVTTALMFVSGGNGSGKSTFLKVLAGLYEPDSGDILLDGVRVNDSNRDAYRSLIAAIFVDYHLFQRLYGIADPAPAEINRLLTQFRLSDKTRLGPGGEFSTLDLSGGQRKRLALIVSLLEKRPILLLDEWTADQDPDFRRKFYDELLPELKRAGETVVVITHDDRYLAELDLPARKLRMDEGRFVAQQP